jgi:hypothetical protein
MNAILLKRLFACSSNTLRREDNLQKGKKKVVNHIEFQNSFIFKDLKQRQSVFKCFILLFGTCKFDPGNHHENKR